MADYAASRREVRWVAVQKPTGEWVLLPELVGTDEDYVIRLGDSAWTRKTTPTTKEGEGDDG